MPAIASIPLSATSHNLCMASIARAPAELPAWQTLPARHSARTARVPVTASALQAPAASTLFRTLGAHATARVGPDTLLGQHPFLSATGGVLGTVATMALVHDVYKRLPAVQQAHVREALHQLGRGLEAFGPYAASAVLAAVSAALGQEGAVRWLESRHLSGALMLLASLPMGLGSMEVLGSKLNIPVLRQAWSGPARFCEDHQADVGGALLGATGVSSAAFASRLLASNNPWGFVLMAGALPAALGGLELVGREHHIVALRDCLSGPVMWTVNRARQVVSKDVALHAVGATLAAAGLWGVGAGWAHLAMAGSHLGDALGAAQITAGTLAAGLGAGVLAERRKWMPSAQQVLVDYNDAMAGAAMTAWGTALAKFAIYNIAAYGPAYLNTGAAALALGVVSIGGVAAFRQTCKKRAPHGQGLTAVDDATDAKLSAAVERIGAISGSVGSGTWAVLIARGLLQGGRSAALLTALNAIPQLSAAAVLSAVSVGMMGYALGNATMKRVSNDVAENLADGTERTLNFAAKHPALTLAGLAALLLLAKQAI